MFTSVNNSVLGLTNPDDNLKRMHQLFNIKTDGLENILNFTLQTLDYLDLCAHNFFFFFLKMPFFENSKDPEQLASGEASCSGSSLFLSTQ